MKLNYKLITLLLIALSLRTYSQDSLRYWSDKLNKTVGSSAEGYFFNNNYWEATGRNYNKILYGQFNGIVAGNEMKMDAIHPEIDVYNFVKGDILVDVAANHDMLARGHTLLWHEQTPSWFNNGVFTRDSLLNILKDHITTIVTHYKGKIDEWDVVNEVIEGDGSLRESKWYTVIGPDYIDSAFVWAHRADPDALLFINDYGAEGINSKSDGLYNLVKGMLERGIPVHGVGMQAHLTVNEINFFSIQQNMKRLNELGLITNFTEVDIKIPAADFNTDKAWADQAKAYGRLLSIVLNNPMAHTLIVWAFSDNDSWIPGHTGGAYGQACMYDFVYRPKPAYYAMLDTLKVHNGVPVTKVDMQLNNTLKIYPNPVKDEFRIESNEFYGKVNAIIFDLNGKKVRELNSLDANTTVNVAGLPKALYLVKLIDNKGIIKYVKLLKQ